MWGDDEPTRTCLLCGENVVPMTKHHDCIKPTCPICGIPEYKCGKHIEERKAMRAKPTGTPSE